MREISMVTRRRFVQALSQSKYGLSLKITKVERIQIVPYRRMQAMRRANSLPGRQRRNSRLVQPMSIAVSASPIRLARQFHRSGSQAFDHVARK